MTVEDRPVRRLAHDQRFVDQCRVWLTRDDPGLARARRVIFEHELAARRAEVSCWSCASLAYRARAEVRNRVRRRPELPSVPGRCRWCGGELTGRRTSWCSQACVDWWFCCTTPRLMLVHLVELHGQECWECGARWEPGERLDDWRPVDERTHGPPWPRRVELQVDHVRPLWSLTDAERLELRWWLPFNLQLLCGPCHRAKTRVEAGARADARRGLAGEQLGMLE